MTVKATSITGVTLTITRVFDAPLERVWQVWTDPVEIKKWWGPEGFSAPHIKNDFRVGGKAHYCMRGPKGSEWDKDMWSMGIYKEIVPMKKIVVTDQFADAAGNPIDPKEFGMPGEWPEEMLVTITFEEAGPGKTKLTLVHEGHPKEMVDMAKQGWNQSLDKFAAAL